MTDKHYTIYHNTKCESCSEDLTKDHSIEVTFSDGERVVAIESSHVMNDGELADIHGLVTNGKHAGSKCKSCGVLLDELDEPDDQAGGQQAESQYEIEKHLVVSTAHIHPRDDALLAIDARPDKDTWIGRMVVSNKDRGFFVYVPNGRDHDSMEKEWKDRGYSQCLLNLIKLVRGLGCQWLTLDADGPTYDNLPTFEW